MIKDINEKKLVDLGFIKEISSPEESGDEKGFHYYCYDIGSDCLLISDANTENDGNYTIEFFEFNDLKITEYVDLVDLIRILKRCEVK